MKTKNPIDGVDVQLRIEIGAEENDLVQPQFTHFSYTITNKIRHMHDQEGPLWEVVGRLERILGMENNVVCSPNYTLFDLGGQLSPISDICKLDVKFGEDEIIEIRNVEFYNYGRIANVGDLVIEKISFVGTIDHKNIAK